MAALLARFRGLSEKEQVDVLAQLAEEHPRALLRITIVGIALEAAEGDRRKELDAQFLEELRGALSLVWNVKNAD